MTRQITIKTIVEKTGLTEKQVRYRLKDMAEQGTKIHSTLVMYDRSIIRKVKNWKGKK